MTQKCPVCTKPVYFAEESKAIGKTFHKLCLKCTTCNKLLDSMSVNDHDGQLFCRACYNKNFVPRGFTFATGGPLSTNGETKANQGGSGENGTENSRSRYGNVDRCLRCDMPVYFAEEARVLGKKYHKKCLVCNNCQKSLDSMTLTNHGNEVYCKSCYAKKFGPRGYGFAGGSSGLSMENGKNGTDNVPSLAKAQAVSLATNGDGPRLGGADACPRCRKPVYFAEERRALGKKYHKLCLCCTECKKQLDSTTLNNHDDKIYCKSCYAKFFGPRGYGFAAGGSMLSSDPVRPLVTSPTSSPAVVQTPVEIQQENVSSNAASPLPAEENAEEDDDEGQEEDGGRKYGGPDCCPRCGKTVYFAEKIVGGGRSWHKLCFRCEDCDKSLESTTLCEAGDRVVCKSCYSKNYGPKGFGFGTLNNTA